MSCCESCAQARKVGARELRGIMLGVDKGDVQKGGGAAAAAVCSAYGVPEASPVCSAVGSYAVGRVYELVASVTEDSCDGAICDVPPPEDTRPAAVKRVAKDHGSPAILASVGPILQAARYGQDPDAHNDAMAAGTIRRALESMLYMRIAAGMPVTESESVNTPLHTWSAPCGSCPPADVIAGTCTDVSSWTDADGKVHTEGTTTGATPQAFTPCSQAESQAGAIVVAQKNAARAKANAKAAPWSTGKKVAVAAGGAVVLSAAGAGLHRALTGRWFWSRWVKGKRR